MKKKPNKFTQMLCYHDWYFFAGVSNLGLRVYDYKQCTKCDLIKVKIKSDIRSGKNNNSYYWYNLDNIPKLKRSWISSEIREVCDKYK